MTPQLIDQLEHKGLRFYLDGDGGLRWRHSRRLTAEERAAVATNREEIEARIRAAGAAALMEGPAEALVNCRNCLKLNGFFCTSRTPDGRRTLSWNMRAGQDWELMHPCAYYAEITR